MGSEMCIRDRYKGEYELLWPDGFPVRIDERKKEEFTKVLDTLLRSTSERMFEDTSQYRLNRMSYLPLTISIDSAVNNVFPYKCVYDGNRDILLFRLVKYSFIIFSSSRLKFL